jgi:hypothetical protein
MAANDLLIEYDGGDASKNTIDARLYGQSLQGLDKMVSDCIIVFTAQRLPKRHERAPLILKVKESEAGSHGTPALIQELSTALGFGVPFMATIGPEIISYYVSAVLDMFKGKGDAVELAISKMAEMHAVALVAMSNDHKEALENMRQIEDHRHAEIMDMQNLLRTIISSSGNAAVDYVAPIGRSVDTATFLVGNSSPVKINKDDADLIRDSQKLDWQTPRNEVLRTDGFKFHTSGLSIENPEREGFLMADVVDPVFEEESNNYTVAAQRRAQIEVLARRGYKNGKLAKIQILDFVREIDEQP